jgi:hypothetical protein
MQVGPPTGQDLAIIDRYRPVAGHYAEQLRLLSPFPATDAGANRVGHRNRLTRAARTTRSARVCYLKTARVCSCAQTTHVCRLRTARVSGLGSTAATLA